MKENIEKIRKKLCCFYPDIERKNIKNMVKIYNISEIDTQILLHYIDQIETNLNEIKKLEEEKTEWEKINAGIYRTGFSDGKNVYKQKIENLFEDFLYSKSEEIVKSIKEVLQELLEGE